jgi:hypothetical protein
MPPATEPTTLAAGLVKRLYIDRAALQRNPAETPREPVWVVACADGRPLLGWKVAITNAELVSGEYDPLFPFREGGTSAWLETTAEAH